MSCEFRKENIFSENGNYLGELMQGRLITNSLKKDTHTSPGFWPTANPDGAPRMRPADEASRELPDGYELFPAFASEAQQRDHDVTGEQETAEPRKENE